MIRAVIVLFLTLPIIEIAGFVVIGDRLGLGLTLLWVLGAALAGLALIRHGGLNAITKLQTALGQQQEPGHSLIDGAVMVVAGLLLIVPGFFSDFLALILVLPVTRNFLLRRAAAHFETRIYSSGRDGGRNGGTNGNPRPTHNPTVIEGEFEIIEPDHARGHTPDRAASKTGTSPRPMRKIENLDDPS